MSSIPPANIAGSIAQGALQQSQVSKSGDAQRREATRQARRLDQMTQKHVESVEDSYETSDEHVTVDEDGEGQSGMYMPTRRHAEESEEEESQEHRPDMKGQRMLPYAEQYSDDEPDEPPQLDVTA